jgi:alkylated DNA repair dioxygenase AlkB
VVAGQRSLFGFGDVALAPAASWTRAELDAACWVDVGRGYLRGADTLLDVLVDSVPWHGGRRMMYERLVDDPRLSYRWSPPDALPDPVLATIRADLEGRYDVPLAGPACNYYRDGRDSVAFHGDRELRDVGDALVAVLTLGTRRPFRLRRHARRGRSIDLSPATGDLLVMGGACQRDWEHGVPKVAGAGPRVSVTWRWSAPRR